jgi:antitoxin CptB
MNASPRLQWQCRRGMRELDELLQGFLRNGYDRLDAGGHAVFEELLTTHDNLLLEYLMGRTVPVDPQTAHVVAEIRRAARP